MQQLKLPTDVLKQLDTLNFAAELCDESGAPKAIVLPVDAYREMLRVWADSAFSPDDLARARAEAGGYTTAEAVGYLKRLAANGGGA